MQCLATSHGWESASWLLIANSYVLLCPPHACHLCAALTLPLGHFLTFPSSFPLGKNPYSVPILSSHSCYFLCWLLFPHFNLLFFRSFYTIYPQTSFTCMTSVTISLEPILWSQCLNKISFLGVGLEFPFFCWIFSPTHSTPIARTHCVKKSKASLLPSVSRISLTCVAPAHPVQTRMINLLKAQCGHVNTLLKNSHSLTEIKLHLGTWGCTPCLPIGHFLPFQPCLLLVTNSQSWLDRATVFLAPWPVR